MHIFHSEHIDTKQLLLVTFCETTVRIGASFLTHTWTAAEVQTDVEVEIVIEITF